MSNSQNEISYYPEICEKFDSYLSDIFGAGYRFSKSQNKNLDLMLSEISHDLSSGPYPGFVAPLKTDIAIGFSSTSNLDGLLLLEVKKGSSLNLMNYSQLVGYLQVAKCISVGLLVLVKSPVSGADLSNDFSRLIELNQLNCDWSVLGSGQSSEIKYRTGICIYTPGNGIDWIDTSSCGGISSWSELRDCLL